MALILRLSTILVPQEKYSLNFLLLKQRTRDQQRNDSLYFSEYVRKAKQRSTEKRLIVFP
jgi:hypothetical protein